MLKWPVTSRRLANGIGTVVQCGRPIWICVCARANYPNELSSRALWGGSHYWRPLSPAASSCKWIRWTFYVTWPQSADEWRSSFSRKRRIGLQIALDDPHRAFQYHRERGPFKRPKLFRWNSSSSFDSQFRYILYSIPMFIKWRIITLLQRTQSVDCSLLEGIHRPVCGCFSERRRDFENRERKQDDEKLAKIRWLFWPQESALSEPTV